MRRCYGLFGLIGCIAGCGGLAHKGVGETGAWYSPLKRFIAADVDESGGLNRDEFARAEPKLSRFFQLADRDGDDEVSLDELAEAWDKYQDQIKTLFSDE